MDTTALQPGATIDRSAPPPRAVLSAVASIFLGHAIAVGYGLFDRPTVLLIGLAFVVAMIGLVAPNLFRSQRAALVVIGTGIVWFWLGHFAVAPGMFLSKSLQASDFQFFFLVTTGVYLTAFVSLWPKFQNNRFFWPILIMGVMVMGAWVIRSSPAPKVDVFPAGQQSAEALLHGRNPYAERFPNIYGDDKSPFLAPGWVVNGRTTYGYSYPPMSLYLSAPAYTLTGDHRYAGLVAIGIFALVLARLSTGPVARGASALFLLTPTMGWIVESGWTEPFLLMFLALTVYAHRHVPRATPLMLGLFIATKQNAWLALPAALLLLPQGWTWKDATKFCATALGVALVVSLPLILWDVREFYRSVIELQFKLPFRADSLSLPGLIADLRGPRLPTSLGLLAAGVVSVLGLRYAGRNAAGFCATVGMTIFALHFFSKGHINYYFFVLGCLALSVVVEDRGARKGAEDRKGAKAVSLS